jgi:cation transport protein ChaC
VQDATWVFGYGSLIWKQDFPYLDSRPARIRGWARRFWQGSHDHRGVPDDPGRVVTLIESPGSWCDGRAFLVGPEVFDHLDHREKNGYAHLDVTIYFASGEVSGVTYHAPPDNFAFLGDAPVAEIVEQIARCSGESGRNLDYVLELARSLRELGVEDPHVFELEAGLRGRR